MQKSVLHIHDKQVKKVAHKLVTEFCLEAVKYLHEFKKKHCKFLYTTLSK